MYPAIRAGGALAKAGEGTGFILRALRSLKNFTRPIAFIGSHDDFPSRQTLLNFHPLGRQLFGNNKISVLDFALDIKFLKEFINGACTQFSCSPRG